MPSEVWAAHPTLPPAPRPLGPMGRSHLGSLPGGGGISLQTSFPTTTERMAPQRCRLGVQEGLLCLQGIQPAPLGVGARGHSCNLWEPEARRREASPAGAPQHPRAAQGQTASDLPSPGPRLPRPQGSGGPSDLGTRPEQPVDGPAPPQPRDPPSTGPVPLSTPGPKTPPALAPSPRPWPPPPGTGPLPPALAPSPWPWPLSLGTAASQGPGGASLPVTRPSSSSGAARGGLSLGGPLAACPPRAPEGSDPLLHDFPASPSGRPRRITPAFAFQPPGAPQATSPPHASSRPSPHWHLGRLCWPHCPGLSRLSARLQLKMGQG